MNHITMDDPNTKTETETTALPEVPLNMKPLKKQEKDRSGGSGVGFGKALFLSIVVVLLGFSGGVVGYLVADNLDLNKDSSSTSRTTPAQPSNSNPTSSTSKSSSADHSNELTPREIYEQVAPAVVHISAKIVSERSFFGIPQGSEESEGTGSGFVIDKKGYIVTNAHVVNDATSLTVSFGEDVTARASVVGIDKSSDIAVIKIDPNDLKDLEGGLVTVPFGSSKDLHVGDPVVAIGNPFSLDRTLTTGVVSALQRDIPALNDFRISNVIQTDAAVNPGNSGGPLLNMQGEVVGVNSQIESRSGGFDGIAFAVPSSTVEKVAKDLIKNGSVQYAWLGVQGGMLTDDLRTKLKVDKGQGGVIISAVTPGSPAARAGIRGATNPQSELPVGGDIITSFDGEKLTSMDQLSSLVNKSKPGDKVKAEILRDGKSKEVTVTLGERPNDITKTSTASEG